jgi:hypothetical protein
MRSAVPSSGVDEALGGLLRSCAGRQAYLEWVGGPSPHNRGSAGHCGCSSSACCSCTVVLAQHACGASLVDDQEAIEEFASDAADDPFGDRIGTRCAYGCPDDAGRRLR